MAAEPGDRAAREAAMLRDLTRPENLPGARGSIDVERTHGSLVLLTGTDVFKLKRAVDFGFFDFTTLEARQRDCEDEVELNRRTAPEVYRGVVPVRLDAEGYTLTRRGGEVVDWAVHMQQLPAARSGAALLEAGELTEERLAELACFVAAFYREAAPHPPAPDELRGNFDENFEQAAPFAGRFVDRDVLDALVDRQRAWLADHAEALAARPARDGHGDLRLEHVYFLDEGPTLIDCIEFNERFRIADPALDVAFLAMDLERTGRPELAAAFLAAFAYEADDYGFWPLVDGYTSYRAFVRAKVACFVAADPTAGRERAARKADEGRALFDLALRVLEPRPRGRVIAVGGLPASGKSTVARALRSATRGVVVSADATRKALAVVAKDEHAGAAAYTPAFSARVADELDSRTRAVVRSGRAAIVDTTFRRRAVRDRFRALARAERVPFTFVECTAPEDVLRARIRARDGDVSDADEDVLDAFLRDHDPIDELPAGEHVRIDTSQAVDAAVARVAGATS